MAWCSDDEYCERVYQRYQKALKIIETYKDSPIEDVAFICQYCKDLLEENREYEREDNKRFRVINLLHAERNEYIYYSKWLEKRVSYLSHHEYDSIIENYKSKHFTYDYDKSYNEYKLNWTDLTRR